jgi:hypothetical protein
MIRVTLGDFVHECHIETKHVLLLDVLVICVSLLAKLGFIEWILLTAATNFIFKLIVALIQTKKALGHSIKATAVKSISKLFNEKQHGR